MPNIRLRSVLPWLVLACSLIAVYGFYQLAYESSQKDLRHKFNEQAEYLVANAEHRLIMQQLLLRGMTNLFINGVMPTREQFQAYMKSMRRSSIMPGVVSIGYAQVVQRPDLLTHQAYWKKKASEHYVVWPKSSDRELAPIVFVEPLLSSSQERSALKEKRIGFDMYSVPSRRAAMEAARDLYSTTITGKNELFYKFKNTKVSGVQIFFPVYRFGTVTGTIEERRKNIIGWVFSPVYPDLFVDQILDERGQGLDMAIFSSNQATPNTLLTRPESLAAKVVKEADSLQYSRLIEVGGQSWLFNIRATPSFYTKMDTKKIAMTLIGGGFLSLLLFLYTLSLSKSRERAEKLARQMTREFQESEYRWHFAIEGQGDGLWDWNLRENYVYYSARCKALLGYSDEEIGSNFNEWEKRLHIEDKQAVMEALEELLVGKNKQLLSEYRLQCKNGSWKWVRGRSTAVERASDGYALRVLGTISDISHKKSIEFQLMRMTNLYAALGYVGQVALRIQNPEKLFDKICRIIVKDGGFKAAWIGLHINDSEHRMIFEHGMKEKQQSRVQSALEDKNSLLATTYEKILESREALWLQNMGTEVHMQSWQDMAESEGWLSFGMIPLFERRNPVGMLALYSDETSPFDSAARDLLIEIANDISQALDTFRHEAERSAAEKALRESEARYSTLFDENSVVLLLVDPKSGAIVNANQQASKFYGWDRETLCKMHINQINVTLDSDVQGEMDKAVNLSQQQFTFRHLTKEGEFRDVEVFSGPVTINGKSLLLSSIHDISERIQAEKALRDSENLNKTILNSLNQHIVLIDLEGMIVWANSSWEKFALQHEVLQTEKSWIGQNYFELLQRTSGEKTAKETFEMIDGIQDVLLRRKDAYETECCCFTGDSILWFNMRVTRLEGERGGGVIAHENITDRKLYEKEISQSHHRLKELSSELVAAQENEKKSLARELHDELGQSFTSLRLNLHQMRDALPDEKGMAAWNCANEVVASMIGKVRSMSTLLRPPALDHFGLEKAIRQLLQAQLVRAGITYVYEYVGVPEKVPPFIEITVYRLVQESITNVVRHAKAKTVAVEINGGEDGKCIEVIVRDDGVGFSASNNPHQGKDTASYGLVGMRERVLLIGGDITIESQPGNGTIITASIPLEL